MLRISCVICTDNLSNDLATTPCGHVFHFACLSQWLAHSNTCPQCRDKCAKKSVIKLYIDSSASDVEKDVADLDSEQLKAELTSARQSKKEQEDVLAKTKRELQDVKEELVAWQCQCNSACQKLEQQKDVASMLKREINRLNEEQKTALKAVEEASRLKTKLQELRHIEHVLEGSEDEVESMVKSYHNSATELAKYLVVLKQNYESLKDRKMTLQSQNSSMSLDLTNMRKAWRRTNEELIQSQNDLALSREEVKSLEKDRCSLQRKVMTLQDAVDSPGCKASLKRMLESPAPEYVLSKKQCNGDLLKELFPDSDEENEKPTENAGAGCSSSNTSSSLMESLGVEANVAITSYSAKKKKQFAHHQSTSHDVLVPINIQAKASSKQEFHKMGYNGMGGQSKITILPKGRQPAAVSNNLDRNKKLKFGPAKAKLTKPISLYP
ncbi:E3 ubiquitin-protein ligase TRAIP-like [Dysidea avara]|uniref:E3 ubiquitin-protein ligase TRAIP-like n=1 Tax=Dysidea avara TaxID=196820 RepID=UPI00332E33C5